MNLESKIQFIIDNEGCEGADGYAGLERFFKYCCTHEQKESILSILKEDIEDIYKELYDNIQEDRVDRIKDLSNMTIFSYDGMKFIKTPFGILNRYGVLTEMDDNLLVWEADSW